MNIAMFLPINDEATTSSTEFLSSGSLHSTGTTQTSIDKLDTAASTSSLEGVTSSASNMLWDCPPFLDSAHPWLENDTYTREYEHVGGALSCTDTYLNTFLSISHFTGPPNSNFSHSDQLAPELSAPASIQWETFLSPDAAHPSLQQNQLSSSLPFSESLSTATTIIPGQLSYRTSMWNRRESPTINSFCAPRSITSPSLHVPKAILDVPRKNISGWGDMDHYGVPAPQDSSFSPNNGPGFISSETEPSRDATQPTVRSRLTKRPKRARHSVVLRESALDNEEVGTLDPLSGEDDTEDDDQNDLDDYHSASPSITPSRLSPSPPLRNPISGTFIKRGGTAKNKKGKPKGSAALALAVVTQLGEAKQKFRQSNADLDELDPIRVYREGGCVIRKRKNQPIPVPVPIPNLNKNCRGRKVPFVAENFGTSPSAGDTAVSPTHTDVMKKEEDCYLPKTKKTRHKGNLVSSIAPDENAAIRSYVCTVLGCGKCFVRGEHLKRHVRSIHTHDKPHVCPFGGCDKSFSRRDNLAQHVRIHLQP